MPKPVVVARLAEDQSQDAVYLLNRGGAPYAMVRDEFALTGDEIPEERHYNTSNSAPIKGGAERAAIDRAIAAFSRANPDWRDSFMIGEIYGR